MNNENIMMDVASLDQNNDKSSTKKKIKKQTTNETVEDLMAKLEQKGKKI
jgi:hypothetical protein